MRINSLELSAYGPFPETVSIDFAELNEAGIFLLNGPTGSGKSSILDAICFALYGSTSMNRPELRSLFAAEDAEPYVILDFEVKGERYRMRRSPAWDRPKKRKTGTSRYTREQAKVDLDKYNPLTEQWEDLIDRPNEAGGFITDLMGLTREQFTQVMLLPQGEFARFLLSSSKDREELLKKLFSTLEFERIQEVLKTLAREAEEKVSQQNQAIEQLKTDAAGALERAGLPALEITLTQALEQVFGENIPADLVFDEYEVEEDADSDDEFLGFINRSLDQVSEHEARTDQVLKQVSAEYEARVKAHEQLATLIQNWTTHTQLVAQKQVLAEQAEPMKALADSIDKALAARAVLQPADALDHAKKQDQKAQTALEHARTQLEQSLEVPRAQHAVDGLTPEEQLATVDSGKNLKDLRHTVQLVARQLEQLVDQEKKKNQLVGQKVAHEESLQLAQKSLEESEQQEAEIRARLTEHADFLTQHQDAAAEEVTANHSLVEAKKALKTAQKLAALRDETKQLEKAAVQANLKREKAVAKVNELYNLRFQQATFILAEELKTGEPCAVCGSREHPQPATIGELDQTVEERHLTKAQQNRDEAEALAQQAMTALESLQQTVNNLVEDGALELADAETRLQTAQSAHRSAKALVKKVTAAQTQLTQAQADLDQHTVSQQAAQAKVTEVQALLKSVVTEIDDAEQKLQAQASTLTFTQRLNHVQVLEQALEQALEADNQYTHAHNNLETAQEALQLALADSHFEDVETARAAAIAPVALKEKQDQLRTYRDSVTANRTRLESDAQLDIAARIDAGEPQPTDESVIEAQSKVHQLQGSVSSLTQAKAYLTQSKTGLETTRQSYTATLAQFAHLIEDAQLKRHLADTANGTDPDNTLKMTLTTFVLAAQLAEVARAASLHLERMTHGRYQLKHSDARKGGGKSGLDIVVHDAWHSTNRAAATLSGGETFMASLSLALGLADVVQQRNGGVDIATLFVDEGFGTLDDSTLEEVMSTLDGLRERGRVIGLISHVTEMKNRIPQQILLTTSPEGSHLVTGSNASFL